MMATVVRVITRLNLGGPAHQAEVLQQRLPSLGFGSELVWGACSAHEVMSVNPSGQHTHLPELRRQPDPRRDWRALHRLEEILRDRRPRIVHTHMAKAGALGRTAARRTNVPVTVHTFHGHVLRGYFSEPVARFYLSIERRLARWTDALVAVSPAIREELLSLGIGKPDQWRVIPIGLELDRLLNGLPPKREARSALGLPQEPPLVAILGRLVPVKDHVTFLESAARVAARRPDVEFVVAGDGERRPDLERRAAGLLGGRVHFLGWVRDVTSLYSAVDAVVLTSRNEGTPVALIEAGAAGLPVVATDVGGVRDVVVDGVTGYLAPPGDPAVIGSRLVALLDEPALGRSLGARARVLMRRYSADRLAAEIADLYFELLNRRRPARDPLEALTN
ncbi:MAG: glycosyltransferase [Actinomycetota bacterium]